MSGGWLIRGPNSEPKGPYPLERVVAGAKRLKSIDGLEVRHDQHTKGQWVSASKLNPIREARLALANQKQPPMSTRAVNTAPPAHEVSERQPPTEPDPPAIPGDRPQTFVQPPKPSRLDRLRTKRSRRRKRRFWSIFRR